MYASRLFSALLILVLRLATVVSSFGTINEPGIIGQHCEHERITRAAFACPPGKPISDGRCFESSSLDQLAGTSGPEGYVGQGSNGAVGAPDMLDPTPEGPEAHCDNADFLDHVSLGLSSPYPRTRNEATAQLQVCVDHLRQRFSEGVDAADSIVDEAGTILPNEVDISSAFCRFSFPELQMHMFSRSKCSAIEGFGRALHGIQDFYAHSNWVDEATPPYGPANPPGLKRDDDPIFLDLRGENDIEEQVPFNLSTGCFSGIMTDGEFGKPGHPLEPGSIDCTGRITHHTLNKDNGLIDPVTGLTEHPGPNTPRSEVEGNFQRAVFGAIKDSRRQWRHFREEIRRTYGTERGNIIICAIVRDRPAEDCYGRRVVILRDDASTESEHRMVEMHVPIQHWLLEKLEGTAHGAASHEHLSPRRPESNPLQHPQNKTEEKLEIPDTSVELPLLTSGLDMATALTELLKNATGHPSNKTAIIALTDAHNIHLREQISHIWRAGDDGVRVHLGLLPPPPGPIKEHADVKVDPKDQQDLITAVLRTGGTYSMLHSRTSMSSFLDHVVSRGLTQYDNARDTATLLLPGLSIGDYVTPLSEPRRFSFDAHAMDNVIISVAPLSSQLSLHIRIRHVRKNIAIKEMNIGLGGNATFMAELGVDDIPRGDAWYELEVGHNDGDGLKGSGLFEVSIESEDVGLSDADRDDYRRQNLTEDLEDHEDHATEANEAHDEL